MQKMRPRTEENRKRRTKLDCVRGGNGGRREGGGDRLNRKGRKRGGPMGVNTEKQVEAHMA